MVRKMYNKVIHFIGGCFCLFGALALMKMAGLGDIGGSNYDIMHYGLAGLTAVIGGSFLTWWTV